jgi:pterin-4a-carbinolamine dehydratase
MKSNPLLFINYRREDEGPACRFVKVELEKIFGSSRIFMDVDSIRSGDRWGNKITSALNKCTVLLVVIGKNWLRLQDEYFRRRIDNEDDWVRTEIAHAIKRKIKIIPVLLGTTMPPQNSLPAPIRALTKYQSLSIGSVTWADDIAKLVNTLRSYGFVVSQQKASTLFPKPRKFPMALSEQELKKQLKKLKGWTVIRSNVLDNNPSRIEIQKQYVFKSFNDAIEFMHSTAPHADAIQHHPRWENLWRSVTIHFSTWDIGFRVSNLDIEMARFFEKEFSKYQRQAGKVKKLKAKKQ